MESQPFSVAQGDAFSLFVATEPMNVRVGDAIAPSIMLHARDLGSNIVAAFTSTVTATVFPSGAFGGIVSGGVTTAVSGIATFDGLSLDVAARKISLEFTAGNLSVVSIPFNCHGSVTSAYVVSFVEGSRGTESGVPFATRTQVSLYDAFGILAETSSDAVRATLQPHDSGATLSGMTSVSALKGVAFFDDLTVDKVGVVCAFFHGLHSSMT